LALFEGETGRAGWRVIKFNSSLNGRLRARARAQDTERPPEIQERYLLSPAIAPGCSREHYKSRPLSRARETNGTVVFYYEPARSSCQFPITENQDKNTGVLQDCGGLDSGRAVSIGRTMTIDNLRLRGGLGPNRGSLHSFSLSFSATMIT